MKKQKTKKKVLTRTFKYLCKHDRSTSLRGGVAFLVKHGLVVNKKYRNEDFNIITENEESEQDKNNREFEQTALKDILNSSAQGNKDRQNINSENNEEKENSNKRVSEESNESFLEKIVKRFKFK